MTDLPAPPTPASADLTDFKFMPLEIARLRKSKAWLICKRKPELAFYMLNLWTAAWHERPAGSLEDDDDILADRAMCDPAKWDRIKTDVLRGWKKHSDGRLYHDVVAEKVAESWTAKQDQRNRTVAARIGALTKRLQHATEPAVKDQLEREIQRLRLSLSIQSTSDVTAPVTDPATESKGREGTGTVKGQGLDSEAKASGADAPSPPPSDQELVWGDGLAWLASATSKKPDTLRAILGRWCQAYGPSQVLIVFNEARAQSPPIVGPVPWIEAALKTRSENRVEAHETESERSAQRVETVLARIGRKPEQGVGLVPGGNADAVLPAVSGG